MAFGDVVLGIVEREMASDGAVVSYGESYVKSTLEICAELASQKEAIQANIDAIKKSLGETLVRKRLSEGLVKEMYESEEKDATKELTRLEGMKMAAEAQSFASGPFIAERLAAVRGVLSRLRDDCVFSSRDPDDIRIAQTWRDMISIVVIPHQHDYGASAVLTIDFGIFFLKPPQPLPPADLQVGYTIVIPPRQKGFRTPPDAEVNLQLLNDPSACVISDGDWIKISEILEKRWRGIPTWPKKRIYYEACLRSLRAGAGPSTVRSDHSTQTSLINHHLHSRGLWMPILKIIGKSQKWVVDMSGPVLVYLQGEGGSPDAAYRIIRNGKI